MTTAPTPTDKVVRIASKVTTVLLHPLLLPIYGALLTLFGATPYAGMPHPVNVGVLSAVGVFACANPLAVITLFMMSGRVEELEMPSREERVWPLICSGVSICLAMLLLNTHNTPRPLLGMVLGEGILLVAIGACSVFWKVSLHTAGSGAFLSFVSVTGMTYHTDFSTWAAVAFVCAGLTAWTRLYERAHTWRQLLAGYLMGLAVMGTVMNFVMHRPVF